MTRAKKCPKCGIVIQSHEDICSYCFVDNLNYPKRVIDNIIKN